MRLELVIIGNEIVLGHTLDSNSADLARGLSAAGAAVARTTTVPDDRNAIADAVRSALGRTGFVITSGGLGPTNDDLTKSVIAEMFDAPLDLDEDYLEQLRRRFERLGRGPMPKANRSQAEIPRGATVLTNPVGTAPGLWLDGPAGTVVMLPGVPRELRHLLEHQLIPRIRDRSEGTVVRSETYRTTGISESALADLLAGVDERIAPITLAYLPTFDGVDLRLTAWHLTAGEAEQSLAAAGDCLLARVGDVYYGSGDLAGVIVDGLRAHGDHLAVAESCTGGLLGARITAIPGSSDVFVGGVVAYSNEVKQRLLGVPAHLIDAHGAVSEPVARGMATGVMELLGSEAAIAITGVAGPGGGTPDKPVGTVHLAACWRGTAAAAHVVLPGDRENIRRRSAQAGLNLLRRLLRGTEPNR
jgi:competence/damage-inducible protein CinA-like protein